MTSLYVSRPSNAMGLTSHVVNGSCVWRTHNLPSWFVVLTQTKSNSGLNRQIGYRDTPSAGAVVRCFRMPTRWFMVADRLIDGGANYRSKVSSSIGYSKVGDELAYTPCAVRGNSPYSTGSKTVTVPAQLSNSSNVKARNKIKNSKVDLGVAFAEANKTLVMIA